MNEMEIDYDKLRKYLIRRDFIVGFFTGVPRNVVECADAHTATHEELIAIANKHHINLDKYRKNRLLSKG